MTVRLTTVGADSASTFELNEGAPRWTCAFVNNMPDGAFDATERQFLGLLEEASGSDVVEVRRHAMFGVPRRELTSARIGAEYVPLADTYDDPPDLLIVTGSNPIETQIQDELYWSDLVELLAWSREYVGSTILSCLSAHAALTVFDGIARTRLSTKLTGVFSQHVDVSQPLTRGLEPEILLPHSRWNSVPREAMEHAGYDVVIRSEETGWGVATREENGRQLILVQGHPEYDPASLLREYRRDAGRFVHHERDDVPQLPYHCVSEEDWGSLERTHQEIIQGERDPLLIDRYPFDDVVARAPWPWRTVATRLFTNWLTSVDQGKE